MEVKMENFIFYNPTRIIFGKDQEKQVGKYAKIYSDNILFLYGGGSIKKTGLYDKIAESLNENNVHFTELSGVEANPKLELVRQGIRLCREKQIKFILAVGGGSAIDTAKAIAVGVKYEGDVWDFFIKKAVPQDALPVGTVLTVVGAGSEMSNSCVISKPDENLKRSFDNEIVIPKFSILNPEATCTVSPYQTASGAADILSHLMERYFTLVKQADVTDRMLEGLMKTVIHYAPRAIKNPKDYDSRAELMWAATLAQNGLLNTGRIGDWGCHAIEHELSGELDIAHGAGLAMITSSWMRYVNKEDKNRFVQFAQRVFDVDFPNYDIDGIIEEGIARLERFFEMIGLQKDLIKLDIDEAVLKKIADRAVLHSAKRGRFLRMDANDIYQVLLIASKK
jgi:alcohol dehydrogenase YqhD (iron-dependent ADH family)